MTPCVLGRASTCIDCPMLARFSQSVFLILLVLLGNVSEETVWGEKSDAIVLPKTVTHTNALADPLPTHAWWSSALFQPFSGKMYPLPLAYAFSNNGLMVTFPKPVMNSDGKQSHWQETDVQISGKGIQPQDARVSGFSDWSVDIELAEKQKVMTTRLLAGSPYFYLRFKKSHPRITFPAGLHTTLKRDGIRLTDPGRPEVKVADDTLLTVASNGRMYVWFAPRGTWFHVKGASLTVDLPTDSSWLIGGFLGEADPATPGSFSPEVLKGILQKYNLLYDHAFAWPKQTKVSWNTDTLNQCVWIHYNVTTESLREGQTHTLQGLLPHQYKNLELGQELLGQSYASVRGPIEILAANQFTLQLNSSGLLPYLPLGTGKVLSRDRLRGFLNDRYHLPIQGRAEETLLPKDNLVPVASAQALAGTSRLLPVAELLGERNIKDQLEARIHEGLSVWFQGLPKITEGHDSSLWMYQGDGPGLFLKRPVAGKGPGNAQLTMLGDIIFSAAILGLMDPNALRDYEASVNVLIRHLANPDREDAWFPWLRYPDVYQGHAWQDFSGQRVEGNYQDNVVGSLHAWAAIALWGAVAGIDQYRDLGLFLFALEYAAMREYAWDYDRDQYSHEKGDPFAMSWITGHSALPKAPVSFSGGDSLPGLLLPITPLTLFSGNTPGYAEEVYQQILSADPAYWRSYEGPRNMFRALFDPVNAARSFKELSGTVLGQSSAEVYAFLDSMETLGKVAGGISADTPWHGVFYKDNSRSYVAFNPEYRSRTVTFSDGFTCAVPPRAMFSSAGQARMESGAGNAVPAPEYCQVVSRLPDRIRLSWQGAEPASGLLGFEVFRDGHLIRSVDAADFEDLGLTPDSAYVYTVRAYNQNGDFSPFSDPLHVVTPMIDESSIAFPPTLYREKFLGGGSQVLQNKTQSAELQLLQEGEAYSGNHSIYIQATGNVKDARAEIEMYAGATAESEGLDLSAFDTLEWYMKADPPCKVKVGVGHPQRDSGYKEKLIHVGSDFQKYKMDCTQLNSGDLRKIGTVLRVILEASQNGDVLQTQVYLDDISWKQGSGQKAPSPPTRLIARALYPDQAILNWQASMTPDVIGYRIYRDDFLWKTVSGTSALDTTLSPDMIVDYQVSAYLVNGRESSRTPGVSVHTPADHIGFPDLLITHLEWDPPAPEAGEKVHFSVTVTNTGIEPILGESPLGVGLWMDGRFITFAETLDPLPPAGEVVLKTRDGGEPWLAENGWHRLRAVVDDAARYLEKDEGNNAYEMALLVDDGQTHYPQILYRDRYMGGGVQDFSYRMEHLALSMTDTTRVWEGKHAMRVSLSTNNPEGHARISFYNGPDVHAEGLDFSEFSALQMAVCSTAPLELWLKVGDGVFDSGFKQERITVHPEWKEVLLPLDSLNHGDRLNMNSLLVITARAADNQNRLQHEFWIDAVRFLPKESLQLVEPQEVTVKECSLEKVEIQWGDNQEGFAGSYRILRDGQIRGETVERHWRDTSIEPGRTYTYNLVKIQGDRNVSPQSESLSVTVPDLPPDLSVAGVKVLPEDLQVGDQLKFHVQVKNSGKGRVPHEEPVTSGFWIDGRFMGEVVLQGPLEAGETRDLATLRSGLSWEATEGKHMLRIFLDPYNRLEETRKDNNAFQQEFTVETFHRFPPVLYADKCQGAVKSYPFKMDLAELDLAHGSTPRTGSCQVAYRVKAKDASAQSRLEFYYGKDLLSDGINLSSFRGLELYVRASKACSGWFRVGDGFHDSGYLQRPVQLTQEWQRVLLDFNSFQDGDASDINVLFSMTVQAVDNQGKLDHTIYLDDIRLIG